MFDFKFVYSVEQIYPVNNVTKITIQTPSGFKEVSGDDILSVNIPLETIYLHSDSGNYTVSGSNLLAIIVTKCEHSPSINAR